MYDEIRLKSQNPNQTERIFSAKAPRIQSKKITEKKNPKYFRATEKGIQLTEEP